MFKTLLAVTAVAAAALPAHAVTLVQWDFESAVAPTSAGTTWASIAPSTGTGNASIVHAAATTAFSTPAGNGSVKAAAASVWGVGDYFQFSFSTTGFSGVSVVFDQTGSNTGPRDFSFAYSTDGTSFTSFAAYSLINGGWSTNPANAVTTTTFTYDLSAITALNNKPTVTLRLIDASATAITGGTVATAGTSRVDNFTVIATPVPEPGTYALLLAGLGAVGLVARRRG